MEKSSLAINSSLVGVGVGGMQTFKPTTEILGNKTGSEEYTLWRDLYESCLHHHLAA